MRKVALTLILGLLIGVSAFAENRQDSQTQKGLTYVMDDFSAGLNTKISPYKMPPTEGVREENLRFNKSLKALSLRDNLNTYGSASGSDPITGIFRSYLKNGSKTLITTHGSEIDAGNDTTGAFSKILSVTTPGHQWSWVNWHNIAIGTDGFNPPVKYDGFSSSATYLGSCLAINSGAGSGPDAGVDTYKVAYYTTDYVVLFNVASNPVTTTGQQVNLSMIPIAPVQYGGEAVIGRKIYRTKANGSTYYLLTTIADNSTVTYADTTADSGISSAMPGGAATYTPPTGRFILVQYNRLFFACDPTNSPSRVWYSEDGLHDVYLTTSYMDVRQDDGDGITFMKGNLGLLTIGKNNTIQKIYLNGSPITGWSISDPFSYIGCQSPYSAVNTPAGIVYLAKDGIYRFNGQWSDLISESVTPVIQDISPQDLANCWGIYQNNMYHLAYTSESSGQHFNNRVLVLDLLAKAYEIDLLNINCFTVFNSGNDWGILYAGASDGGNVYAYSSEVNEVVHKTQEDFTGQWDSMRYVPILPEGGVDASPILQIARTGKVNELTGTIASLMGTIIRQDYNGHYVSQALLVGATTLSKLYWNEVLPTGGSVVSFQIRTSPTGNQNLLYDDSFEWWDDYPYGATPVTIQPNDWPLSFAGGGSGGAATASSTQTTVGIYSAQLTKPNTGQTVISQILPNSSSYRNLTMTFDGWMKSANSKAGAVYFQITDGATTKTLNYINNGSWAETSGTITISSTANTITTKCVVDANATAPAYFDQVMLVQGSTAKNDWTAWSTPVITNPNGADISGVSADAYLQYLINMTTDNLTISPSLTMQSGYNVELTYNKEGKPQSTAIPFHYTSGFLDFGNPSQPKILRSIETYHSGVGGVISITITNYDGLSNTWNIDTSVFPNHYKEYATTGGFRGREFFIDITYNGILPMNISKIIFHYDTEPEQGNF